MGKLLEGMNVEMEVNPQFIMDSVYGAVDGLTAVFADNCRGGIFATIGSVKSVLDNMAFVIPAKAMKFGISLTNLTEGMNTTFAMCDLSPLWTGLAKYIDYYHWENYVIIGSRIGGYMISDFWVQKDCIEEGIAGDMGYDVGMCAGNIVSTMLDVKL